MFLGCVFLKIESFLFPFRLSSIYWSGVGKNIEKNQVGCWEKKGYLFVKLQICEEGRGIMSLKISFLFGVLVLLSSWISCGKASVSYDHKAISINGQRKILISGSIHYPRSTPEVCFFFLNFFSLSHSFALRFLHIFYGVCRCGRILLGRLKKVAWM